MVLNTCVWLLVVPLSIFSFFSQWQGLTEYIATQAKTTLPSLPCSQETTWLSSSHEPMKEIGTCSIRYISYFSRSRNERWEDHRSFLWPSLSCNKESKSHLSLQACLTTGDDHAWQVGNRGPSIVTPTVLGDRLTVGALVKDRPHFPPAKPQRPVLPHRCFDWLWSRRSWGRVTSFWGMNNNCTVVIYALVQNKERPMN